MPKKYTDRQIRESQRIVERERQRSTFEIGSRQPEDHFESPRERWARTTTNADFPTYPAIGNRKFVVEFGDYLFNPNTITNETAVFTAYAPKTTRIAYSRFGYIGQNTIVRIAKCGIGWFVQPTDATTKHKAKTTSTITDGGSGTVNVWKNGVVTSPVWTLTAWLNWMNGTSTIASGKEVKIEWFQDEANGVGKWIITEREC